jgi:protein-tyrosine phosphatase
VITHVLERLAVGAAADARRSPEKFTAVLNVAEEVDLDAAGKTCHKIPLKDLVPISPEAMSEAILWIKEHIRHQGVLVVCKAGIGRSPSIVIGYLCSIGFGYDEAVRFVGSKQSDISPVPNLAFSIEDCIGFYL